MTIPATKRRRGRPSLDDDPGVDESECLAVALEAFAEKGFDGTSVREIARTLNVSHGLLNAKFGSKQGLWQAAVSHGMDTLHAHMSRLPVPDSGDCTIVEQLRLACRNFILGLAQVPAIIRLMNAEGSVAGDRLDHIVDTFFRHRIWPLQTLLRDGQRAGLFVDVHAAVPFTLLAHGAGALIALRPLVDAADPLVNDGPDGPVHAATQAADIIVRGLLREREVPRPGR